MVDSVQHQVPAGIPPGNDPGTQGIGDWVCPRARPDISDSRKSPPSAEIRNQDRPDPSIERLRNLKNVSHSSLYASRNKPGIS
jgi:hypothetical protein